MSGGCFVEGDWLRNAFRWKETIGPWEERPGHFGDVWHYWTDDGFGHFEFLQVRFVISLYLQLSIHESVLMFTYLDAFFVHLIQLSFS